MKKMKKVLAGLLAATMVMSMSITSFAAVTDDYTSSVDVKPVVPKTYKVNNGTAPAETFTYTFTGVGYVDNDGKTVENATIPDIDPVTISFDAISADADETVEIDIDATKYNLGVYTYKVVETPGDKAGVTYSPEELYLVLTILRDENSDKHYVAAMHYHTATGEDKSSGFTNVYDSGSLSVTKQITGNMADMSKKFTFTVVFTAAGDTEIDSEIGIKVAGTIPRLSESIDKVEAGTYYVDNTGKKTITYTFVLGDGETAEFTNVPATVTYTVTENNENYEQLDPVWVPAELDDEGTLTIDKACVEKDDAGEKTTVTADSDAVEITNKLQSGVDTGIILDSAPYILLLAVAALGMFAVVNKKREEEF